MRFTLLILSLLSAVVVTAAPLARYQIVNSSSDAREVRAAEELRDYLGRITGAEIAVVAVKGGAPAILLAGVDPVLGEAGVSIRAEDDGDLVLSGGTRRGSLSAAYRFLDELGVRWWVPGAETVPADPDVEWTAGNIVEMPVFPDMRDPQTALANNPEWTLRNLGNGIYSGVPEELGGFFRYADYDGRWWMGHTYDSILPATPENFERYPEAFMMLPDGTRTHLQLCPSSPTVREMAAQRVIEAMKGDPTGEINLAQSDFPIRCACPACEELIAYEETPAAPHLALVNHVARAVREAGILDRNIIFLGYQQTRKPPKHMKMEPNTTLWLCTDIQAHAKHLPIRDNAEFAANLAKWREITPRIYIWDYYVNFNNFLNYEPTLYSIADNLRFYRDNGVTGVMLQGDLQSPGGAMQEVYTWVFERLLWDPSLEIRALLAEFVGGYYGAAAPPMLALYNEVCRWGEAGILAAEDYPAFDAFEGRCLAEARALAGEDPVLLGRLEMASIPRLVRSINSASMDACREGRNYSASLLADIETLRDIARRHDVRNFSEGGSLDGWIDRIMKREGLELAPYVREEQDATVWKLSSLWKFRPLNLITTQEEIDREIAAGVAADCDDSGWNDYMDCLGIGWEEQGFPGFDGFGIFRNSVDIGELRYRHYYLLFGSVDEEAWVYVNGEFAFESTIAGSGLDKYNIWNHPFGGEVTGLLKPGRNLVAFSCYDSAQMGGIYMPVWLIGSDRELTRRDWWVLSQAVHPYGLDGGDELFRMENE